MRYENKEGVEIRSFDCWAEFLSWLAAMQEACHG